MTDRDKIRADFEQALEKFDCKPGSDWERTALFLFFKEGIAHGQRDIIEVMDVVGYRYYVDKMDYWELVDNPVTHRICYPVYAFPEDVAK